MNDSLLDDKSRVQSARRHVAALRGFYHHLAVYLAVNGGLALLNLIATRQRWWFSWTLFGWGIGLLLHATKVFAFQGWLGSEWEQRKIRAILEKSNRH